MTTRKQRRKSAPTARRTVSAWEQEVAFVRRLNEQYAVQNQRLLAQRDHLEQRVAAVDQEYYDRAVLVAALEVLTRIQTLAWLTPDTPPDSTPVSEDR